MRKVLMMLAMLVAPMAANAAPEAGPQKGPSNVDLATALCDSNDATAEQTIIGCTMLIKAGAVQGADLADTYNNRAAGYLGKKQWALAIGDADKAIALVPANATAFNNRCLGYAGKKLIDKALGDCSQAIKLAPGNGHFFRNRAGLLLQKGKRPEALADLRSALKLDPKDPYAMQLMMRFVAKSQEGGLHIVDAKHPAPAALTARMGMGEQAAAKPDAKPQPTKPAQ